MLFLYKIEFRIDGHNHLGKTIKGLHGRFLKVCGTLRGKHDQHKGFNYNGIKTNHVGLIIRGKVDGEYTP